MNDKLKMRFEISNLKFEISDSSSFIAYRFFILSILPLLSCPSRELLTPL